MTTGAAKEAVIPGQKEVCPRAFRGRELQRVEWRNVPLFQLRTVTASSNSDVTCAAYFALTAFGHAASLVATRARVHNGIRVEQLHGSRVCRRISSQSRVNVSLLERIALSTSSRRMR